MTTAPSRKLIVVWANGPQFAVRDSLGNWRNRVGGFLNSPPKAWDYLPEKPK